MDQPSLAEKSEFTMREDIKEIIINYGSDIICSEIFRESFEQKHHYKTTVGDHILGVTAEAVKFCIRHGMTDDKTLSNVVTSSLCHDLGILGRDEKYNNNLQTLMRHPGQSAEAYIELTGEENKRVLNAINAHMFPLKPKLPKYKEGWVLTFADKIRSSMDILKIPPVTAEEREELLELAKKRNSEEKSP